MGMEEYSYRVIDCSSPRALKVGTANNGNTMAAEFYTAGMIKTCTKSIVLSTHLSIHDFNQNPPFLLTFDSYFRFRYLLLLYSFMAPCDFVTIIQGFVIVRVDWSIFSMYPINMNYPITNQWY